MKKIIAIITAAFLFTALMTGCKGNNGNTENSSVPESISTESNYLDGVFDEGASDEIYEEGTESDNTISEDVQEEPAETSSDEAFTDSSEDTNDSDLV